MEFSEQRIQKQIPIGNIFKHTFTYNGEKKIDRVNPLCNCIKSNITHPYYTFWYKVKNTSLKVIVITYSDGSKDFLELQATL
jgi:hypothetical protein